MTVKTANGVHVDENALIAEQTKDERETQRKATDTLMADNELEHLLAERAALAERIKALQATRLATKLPVYVIKSMLPRVQRRIKGGADREDALDRELAMLRAALILALDRR